MAGGGYDRAVGLLGRALTFGIHPSLDGVRALTDAMGRPQEAYDVVQVTGTNGKSSVTRMIAALLTAEGLETGAYTSPHLESYTERIEIVGSPCSPGEFAAAIDAAATAARSTGRGMDAFTEFELLTAAALWLYREREVDVACLEVGMGGRWDATSVAEPRVAVVTGVGLDHTERLGSTLEAIAFDKSHIIRPGSAAVLGPGTLPVADVLLERAESVGVDPVVIVEGRGASPVSGTATMRFTVTARPDRPGGTVSFRMRGLRGTYADIQLRAPSYQAPNAAVAIGAAECHLGRAIRVDAMRTALASMRFPGRFEVVLREPPLVLDGAHNPQAAAVLASAIAEAWPEAGARPVCVLGVLADKDAQGIVEALAPVVAGFVVTQPDSPRALPAGELAARVEAVTGSDPPVVPDPVGAARSGQAISGDLGVVVTGSLHTVGQVRTGILQ